MVVSNVGNAGMLWQAGIELLHVRITGGFLNEGVSHKTDLPRTVENLSHATPTRVARFEAYLKADKIGAIVLDARFQLAWAASSRRSGSPATRSAASWCIG